MGRMGKMHGKLPWHGPSLCSDDYVEYARLAFISISLGSNLVSASVWTGSPLSQSRATHKEEAWLRFLDQVVPTLLHPKIQQFYVYCGKKTWTPPSLKSFHTENILMKYNIPTNKKFLGFQIKYLPTLLPERGSQKQALPPFMSEFILSCFTLSKTVSQKLLCDHMKEFDDIGPHTVFSHLISC